MFEWLALSWMLDVEHTNWEGSIGEAESQRVLITIPWERDPWSTRIRIPLNGDQPIWQPERWKDYSDFRIRQIQDINESGGKLVKGHDHLYDIQVDVLYNSVGVSVVFPNSEDGTAARGQLLIGPQFKTENMRLTHHFNVNGDKDINTNITTIELFFEKEFENVTVFSHPEIMVDWEAVSDNRVALPISLGIRTNNKLSIGIEGNYFVLSPDRFGPEWQIGIKIKYR